MALTELQAKVLERRLSGDTWEARYHFMFCATEREKYVQVWKSAPNTVVSEATTNALFKRGYYEAGDVTEAGRFALAEYRARNPLPK